MRMEIKVKKLRDVETPTYGSEGATCFDFYAPEDITVSCMLSNKIPLGLSFEIPRGYTMLIMPRYSTGLRTSLRQSNSIGVIDSDYRGEVVVIFDKLGFNDEKVKKGERIAQGIILPVPEVKFVQVYELNATKRGNGGLGSTGK